MPDSTLVEIMQALADQIQSELCGTADPLIEQLQVVPLLTFNPTPPAIDVYPSTPFQEGAAFGKANNRMFFTVRARIGTADNEAGQNLLLSMMDPSSETSMALAILSDQTLDSNVSSVSVEGPSDYGLFVDPGGDALLGCTWRVGVFP